MTGMWSQAGSSATCEAAGMWYAALPQAEWPEDEESRQPAQLEHCGREGAVAGS